ncbi:hypothetical protein ACFQRL_14210 [Microbacterium fluvii]|uniref:FCP1 homology domain-containing protein n=1 Tax=Microbacterium fluvii TaxID=415215 RepID=A0ABW2HG38_9MICO|nr:hypothetical protein [Microbacterium fluvii]MCU4673743.1 hypothetical protein [Microbacterium fluvii]
MTDENERYRPVVAVDVDGVLRTLRSWLSQPDPNLQETEVTVTIRRDAYPTVLHSAPDWDENDEWTTTHFFSTIAVEWVRSLLDRGVEVVWATTWQQYANTYFAPALGLPDLPVGVSSPPRFSEDSPDWKARNLARQFDGRPLLWVDDNPIFGRDFERARLPADRALTRMQWIRNPSVGITAVDIADMDAWLALASSAVGQEELRRRRRRDLSRDAARNRRAGWGSESNYRRWIPVRRRLETEAGLDSHDICMLGSEVRRHPDGLDEDAITVALYDFGLATDPPIDVIVSILHTYRPCPGGAPHDH